MASTTPLRQADGRPGDPQAEIAIDPEVILAGRIDRLTSGSSSDPVRRSPERQQAPVPSVAPPSLDTGFRASHADMAPEKSERSSFGKWVLRFLATLLFAIVSAVAAAAWQMYGDQAQDMIARWTPKISLSSTNSATSTPTPQPAMASADPAPQPVATTQPAPAPSAASAAPAASPESTELLQSMARDVAALSQQVGDLKASIAQLKTSQDQMTRDMARLTEARPPERMPEARAEAKPFNPAAIAQTIRPKPKPARTAAAPGAAPAAPRAPKPAPYPPTQTTAPASAAPAQLPPLQTAPVPVR